MGVKKAKPFEVIILMLLWVLVPFLLIKFLTTKPDSSRNFGSTSVTSESSYDDVVSDSTDGQVQTVNLSDYTVTNDGSYGRAYTKNSKGLYELSGPVMDVAKILSEDEYYNLNSFLWNLSDKTGAQIVVFTVPSLDGVAVETFSIEHASYWELGQKGVDNGVLLTVAMEEHDIRIETGYGAEGSLTDAKCARIIRNVIAPAFQQGKYGEGITRAVQNMAGILENDPSLVTISESDEGGKEGLVVLAVFLILFVVIVIFAFSHQGTGGGPRITSVPTSFSSFSSGSSGFSFHGGGGSFGGGGASGRW